jgi:bifunctional non-homologous end joining protein LigD
MGEEEARWRLDGRTVRVTRLDRVLWPADGITKGDLLDYYRELAPVFLPYFRERPVTLHVFPKGVEGTSYYRRDRPERAPAWLRGVPYRPKSADHVTHLPTIEDAAGLVWYANGGTIEFHLWGARLPDLAEPDWAIFDLDPGESAPFAAVLRAALRLREALAALDLRGYAKTSGGRGLHVYLPLAPGHTFEEVRAWVRALAARLAAAHPDLVAVARGATHRGGLVTVDYAQNSIGRNTAAPYTVRARPGAPVSAPVTWEEVAAGGFVPEDLTMRTAPERVRRLGDPFAAVLAGGQRLPALDPPAESDSRLTPRG